ncbi:MAG: VWA domain-containing protein [Desulfurococcales archaeon]|nr:VWA domain-containing protein [Desulfurococcales archaeon]
MSIGVEVERPLLIPLAIAGALAYTYARIRLGPRLIGHLVTLYNPLVRWVKASYKINRRVVLVEALAIGLGLLALSGPILSYTITLQSEEKSRSILEVPPRPGLVLVIDISGSMGGWKLETVKEAAIMLVEGMDESIDIGVVSFSHTLGPSMPPTSDRDAVKRLISNLTSAGGTMYTYPLETAYSWLKIYRSYGLPTAMVFLSDGIPADRASFWSIVDDIKNAGITIYTVYTGDSQLGASLLKDMAKATGGRAYSASDASGILKAFEEIAREANRTLIEAVAEAEAVLSVEVTVEKPVWSYLALSSLTLGVLSTLLRYLKARLFF